MEIAFKRNGQLYNQHYAWVPTRMTSGIWVWLSLYYSRELRNGTGWIVMSPFEFMLDVNKRSWN